MKYTQPRTKGQKSAALPKGEAKDTLLHYHYQMMLIRRFEEKASEMYTKAHIGGTVTSTLVKRPPW